MFALLRTPLSHVSMSGFKSWPCCQFQLMSTQGPSSNESSLCWRVMWETWVELPGPAPRAAGFWRRNQWFGTLFFHLSRVHGHLEEGLCLLTSITPMCGHAGAGWTDVKSVWLTSPSSLLPSLPSYSQEAWSQGLS